MQKGPRSEDGQVMYLIHMAPWAPEHCPLNLHIGVQSKASTHSSNVWKDISQTNKLPSVCSILLFWQICLHIDLDRPGSSLGSLLYLSAKSRIQVSGLTLSFSFLTSDVAFQVIVPYLCQTVSNLAIQFALKIGQWEPGDMVGWVTPP